MGLLATAHLLRRTRHQNTATTSAPFRAQINDPVRGFDDVQVVLDDDDGVAPIPQLVQYLEQLLDIVEVQPGGRLIQNIEGLAGVPLGELPRQLDPLRLAARERGGGLTEHDEDAIRLADHVLDIGPGAGVHGGAIVAQGTPEEIIANPESLTGDYLSGRKQIAIPAERTPLTGKWLKLKGASGNNLRNVNLDLPIGVMTCVTGVSGSGKSTLINDTLFRIAHRELNKATESTPAPYRSVEGLEHLDKVVDIDQSPIGRTRCASPPESVVAD